MYIMSNFRLTAAPIFHRSTISAAMKPAKMDERSAKKTKVEKEKASLFSHFSATTAERMTMGMYANRDPNETMSSRTDRVIAARTPLLLWLIFGGW